MTIGRLQKVKLRDIWPREDTDFTNWLNENLHILGETIGLDLGDSETEVSFNDSDFRVDIRTITKDGEDVIIENQLEQTNHKHLGQIMTYMINMEATIAIWIAKKMRQEHINVINWLNESTNKDFYLVQLEGYQIDRSNPAPLMTVICKPSRNMKVAGQQKKELSERIRLKRAFWEGFLEKANNKTSFFSKDKVFSWTARHNKIGTTGIQLGCYVNAGKTAVSVLFEPDLEKDFLSLKKDLEAEIGFYLEQRDKSKSRGMATSNREGFIKWLDRGGYQNPKDEWDQIQEEMLDHFVKLEKALKPMLSKLKKTQSAA